MNQEISKDKQNLIKCRQSGVQILYGVEQSLIIVSQCRSQKSRRERLKSASYFRLKKRKVFETRLREKI